MSVVPVRKRRNGSGSGIPQKTWDELADRSKRLKVTQLSKENKKEALILAAEKSARSSGEPDQAFVIRKS